MAQLLINVLTRSFRFFLSPPSRPARLLAPTAGKFRPGALSPWPCSPRVCGCFFFFFFFFYFFFLGSGSIPELPFRVNDEGTAPFLDLCQAPLAETVGLDFFLRRETISALESQVDLGSP